MSTLYVCVGPLQNSTGQAPPYNKGKDYAACPPFEDGWNQSYSESQGYGLVFVADFENMVDGEHFPANYANRIAGCDGQQFGRPLRSEKVQVFVNDIYRTFYIEHDSNQDWHGISLRRYKIQNKDLQNATLNKNAANYYQHGPSGLENISSAAGIPSWVSKPHFFDGEDKLAASVIGLSPNIVDHDSYLDIEPMTGLFARAAKRLQLNYVVNNWYAANISTDASAQLDANICSSPRITNETYIKNCQLLMQFFDCLAIPSDFKVQEGNIYYPYAWAEESFELTSDDAAVLKESLFMFVDLSEQIGFWCLVTSAFFLCAITVITWMYKAPIEKVFAPRLSADVKFHTGYMIEETKFTDVTAVHNALFSDQFADNASDKGSCCVF